MLVFAFENRELIDVEAFVHDEKVDWDLADTSLFNNTSYYFTTDLRGKGIFSGPLGLGCEKPTNDIDI